MDLSACPSCGADTAECLDCGHDGAGGYAPGVALRASYSRTAQHWRGEVPDASKLFRPRNRNGAAQMAVAFATYALIPYLGLLFCPGALLCGVWGLVGAYRRPQQGGRGAAVLALVSSCGLGALQVALWWLLYQVPRWAGTP